MACGKSSLKNVLLNGLWKVQKPYHVGDCRTVLTHPLGNLGLAVPKLLNHPLVGHGLFNGVEVLPLDVLDKGHLQGLIRRVVLDYDGHLLYSGELGCAPAPFACDYLVAPLLFTHHQGLNQSLFPDGVCKPL